MRQPTPTEHHPLPSCFDIYGALAVCPTGLVPEPQSSEGQIHRLEPGSASLDPGLPYHGSAGRSQKATPSPLAALPHCRSLFQRTPSFGYVRPWLDAGNIPVGFSRGHTVSTVLSVSGSPHHRDLLELETVTECLTLGCHGFTRRRLEISGLPSTKNCVH